MGFKRDPKNYPRPKKGTEVEGDISEIMPGADGQPAVFNMPPAIEGNPPACPPPNPISETRTITVSPAEGVPVDLLVRSLEVLSRRIKGPLVWQAVSENMAKVFAGRRTFTDVRNTIEQLISQ